MTTDKNNLCLQGLKDISNYNPNAKPAVTQPILTIRNTSATLNKLGKDYLEQACNLEPGFYEYETLVDEEQRILVITLKSIDDGKYVSHGIRSGVAYYFYNITGRKPKNGYHLYGRIGKLEDRPAIIFDLDKAEEYSK